MPTIRGGLHDQLVIQQWTVKVAAWRVFKHCIKVIFMADQVPKERQYALILAVGGDEAFNYWNTLKDKVTDTKDPEQVWNAFKQSFE